MTDQTNASAETKEEKYLTVEFAGICCLVENSERAAVVLPDVQASIDRLAKADKPGGWDRHGAPHTATLIAPSTGQPLSPVYTVSVPGSDWEYDIWNLAGCKTVRFNNSRPRTALRRNDDTAIVGDRAATFDRLVNLSTVTGATTLTSAPLLTTWIDLPGDAEIVAIKPPQLSRPFGFAIGQDTPAKFEWHAWRFAVRVPFYKMVSITLEGQPDDPTLEFRDNASIVIGNLCQGGNPEQHHFYSYYSLLDGGRHPLIVRPPATGANPRRGPGQTWENWEYCFVVILPLAAAMWPLWLP